MEDCDFELDNIWLKDFPFDLKSRVIERCLNNYDSSIARYKNSNRPFKLKYKTKKMEERNGCSIPIIKKYWNKISHRHWWYKLWGDNNKKFSIDHDCVLITTNTKKHYINYIDKSYNDNMSKENIIVCDPGLRTFQTCYDVKNDSFIEIAPGVSKTVRIQKHFIKKMQSKISKNEFKNHKERYNFKKAYKRALERMRNRVDNLHKCTAKYFCDNYNTIIIPKLNILSSKRISSKIKSVSSTLSHCGFIERLITKSSHYNNCKVFVCTEEYTSKSCSNCGAIKYDLGANKTYKCNYCNFILDRDFNAARNILFKFLKDINAV